ncbi:MAG: hypothetical protein P4L98_22630 [Ancalomicrobiaceae bacterium]|nr:hypothetical protein [Ancalomicrobiaceae bacterium]
MIIASCGIQGSASTWTYNVLRELLGRWSVKLASGSFENWDAIASVDLSTTDCLLFKCHSLRHDLADILALANASFVVTTRDPLDCAVSLHSRIFDNEIDAIKNIVRSFASIATVLSYNRTLLLPFHAGFPEQFETIQAICTFLEIEIRMPVKLSIFEQFRRQNVERMISLESREAEVSDAGFRYDKVSLFNESHFTRLKRSFSPAMDQDLRDIFGGFRRDNLTLVSGDQLSFSELIFYFDVPWPPLDGPGIKVLNSIYLPRGVWQIDVTGSIAGARITRILVCQTGQVLTAADVAEAEDARLSFVHRNVRYDDDYQVFVEGDIPEFNPRREDRFRLKATLLQLVESRSPMS